MKINKLDAEEEEKEKNENEKLEESNYNDDKADNGSCSNIRSDSIVNRPENRVTSDERWKKN